MSLFNALKAIKDTVKKQISKEFLAAGLAGGIIDRILIGKIKVSFLSFFLGWSSF